MSCASPGSAASVTGRTDAVIAESEKGARQKYALVIGNGAYANITRLKNPESDARDMETVLKSLGFTVEAVINGSAEQMENAVTRLKNRLSESRNTYGFFFYAGHGVQSSGENYLIPVDANIQSESYLRQRAVQVQALLDELNVAGNELNIVVLDACRDNPFGWSRSTSRGLYMVAKQPADSIIVYATSAGETAMDGEGRNGLFTGHLLSNLKIGGLDVKTVFDLTMGDVIKASGSRQRPAVYSQYPGTAYLGAGPQNQVKTPQPDAPPVPAPVTPQVHTGSVTITSEIAGMLLIDGKETGVRIKAQGSAAIANVSAGTTEVAVREDSGAVIRAAQSVVVRQGQTVAAVIERPRPAPQPAPAPKPASVQPPAPPLQRPVPADMVWVEGGTFSMGSFSGQFTDERPPHMVTVRGFYMGKYEVTQKEWREVMGNNPSNFKGDNLPVEKVSWFNAIAYCNRRSEREGLTPAYTIKETQVSWNQNANGYRLPTEAEWEYAAKERNSNFFEYKYAGSDTIDVVGWYNGDRTHPVGTKLANSLGIYDLSGNVWEWCWDRYGNYPVEAQTNPTGPASGRSRVWRGGSWSGGADYYCRTSFRFSGIPNDRSANVGFRVVRS